MTEPVSIVAAGNTYNSCLLLLRSKGYQLGAEESGKGMIWTASGGNCHFVAYSPPELLGIVVMWENFGNEWNQQHPNLIGEITEQLP